MGAVIQYFVQCQLHQLPCLFYLYMAKLACFFPASLIPLVCQFHEAFVVLMGVRLNRFLQVLKKTFMTVATMHNQHLRKDRASENFCLDLRYLHISCQHQRILLYRTPRRMYTVIRN